MTWRAFIQLLVSLLGLRGVRASNLPSIDGVSRRAFLRTLGVSAAALATAPAWMGDLDAPLVLDERISGFDLAQWDSLLKEVYVPAISQQLNEASPLMSFMERRR